MTLKELFMTFLKYVKIIVIFPIILVTVVAYLNYTQKAPVYSTSATLYVIDSNNATASNIAYVEMLMYDYQQLGSTSYVRELTQTALGTDYPYLGGTTVSVSMNIDNHVMYIKATGSNPAVCANVANVYSTCMINYLSEKLGATNISILEAAKMPSATTGPQRKQPIMYAGIAGAALGIALMLIIEFSNTTIRTPEDIEKEYNLPVLGEIAKFRKKGKD